MLSFTVALSEPARRAHAGLNPGMGFFVSRVFCVASLSQRLWVGSAVDTFQTETQLGFDQSKTLRIGNTSRPIDPVC